MSGAVPSVLRTRIPARLDRLPWSRFHLRVVAALGVTWVLDGLEVTLVGALGGILVQPETLGLSAQAVGALASSYVVGAVIGALIFGYLTDRLGRKRMFFVTLAVYLVGVLLSAFSWNGWSLGIFRFVTGLGIGGEYSAINSAIDEIIPARLRGRIDLIVNGSFWLGAGLGAAGTIVLLNPSILSIDLGWRLGFAIGAALGLIILFMRRHVPESPRWLATHGRGEEAERLVGAIEAEVRRETGKTLSEPGEDHVIHPHRVFGFGHIVRQLLGHYRRRGVLGLVLMIAQAFLYNSIFFSYGLVLVKFYDVPGADVGLYLFPLAIGNFMGPLLLGRLFDTVGRRIMISATFAISAVLLAVTGWAFAHGLITEVEQTILWTVIFFFASAAASSAYLTVSEIFPLETRAMAIAFFYAVGTAVGGSVAPLVFGHLIESQQRGHVFAGYLVAAALMLIAAVTEVILGVDAENKGLEAIAHPMSWEEDD